MSGIQGSLSLFTSKDLFPRRHLTDGLERTSIWDVDDEKIEDACNDPEIYDEGVFL